MRIAAAIAYFLLFARTIAFPAAAAEPSQTLQRSSRSKPIALRHLVASGDSLARQQLQFDATFAQVAVEYLKTGNEKLLPALARSPAAAHMLRHARNFDYDVPKTSTTALVTHLLIPRAEHLNRVGACERSLAFFTGPMLHDPHWLNDTLRYLPADFRFQSSLFLTFGYDIGVAFPPDASLNCAHAHFEAHPRELEYYAIHELHHVGFMRYQPPPRLSAIKTCADLVRLVEYSTQLEGMAVWAAFARRRSDGALAEDADYVALQDEPRMRRDEQSYFDDLHYLQARASEPADASAWAVVSRMSSGERLWYRVGARMAQRIEEKYGRAALVGLVLTGPASFLDRYASTTPGIKNSNK